MLATSLFSSFLKQTSLTSKLVSVIGSLSNNNLLQQTRSRRRWQDARGHWLFYPKYTPQPHAHVKHNDPSRPRLDIGNTGSVFETKIKRRTEIANPNEPKDPLFYTRKTEGLKWTDHRMLRDIHRRRGISEYFILRQNLMCIKKNHMLPEELRVQGHRDLQLKLPIITATSHCVRRCVISSRGRGVVHSFRLSRFFFRHFADYNQLSGVQKSMWGP